MFGLQLKIKRNGLNLPLYNLYTLLVHFDLHIDPLDRVNMMLDHLDYE